MTRTWGYPRMSVPLMAKLRVTPCAALATLFGPGVSIAQGAGTFTASLGGFTPSARGARMTALTAGQLGHPAERRGEEGSVGTSSGGAVRVLESS
jgi:hypothetical protein